MIVPRFWAEGRVQTRRNGRQVTVRRFGWSDASQADAQANADARAAEALDRILRGERLDRREHKVPYNGADGLPIREEIVARFGDAIITRNAYGARCLNTPNVLFADVDFETVVPEPLLWFFVFVFTVAAAAAGLMAASWCLGLCLVFVALALAVVAAGWVYHVYLRTTKQDGASIAARRIRRFTTDHPEWAVRLYRTPAGLRLLVTHRPFEPNDPAVREFFDAVGADPVYVRMCVNQQCFRARVGPKPWRIGIEAHMKPRPGVWPVRPERLPERQAWIESYEAAAQEFASCEFVEAVGSGIVHPTAAPVVMLHDELSRATSGLPIA